MARARSFVCRPWPCIRQLRLIALLNERRWKRYVTLKVLTNDVLSRSGRFMELEVSKRIRKEGHRHWASAYVRCVTDSFEIPGPDGKHMCLVYKPLREDLFTFQRSIQGGLMYVEKSKSIIRHVLAELDFLHRHCHVIHTGLLPAKHFRSKPFSRQDPFLHYKS